MMIRFAYLAAVLLVSTPALAYEVNGVPCNDFTKGQSLIISRPPTEDELAVPVDPGRKLVLMHDHVVCDGNVWTLDHTVSETRALVKGN